MIAEPYICIKGKEPGRIEWFSPGILGYPDDFKQMETKEELFKNYADFEREKLRAMDIEYIRVCTGGYTVKFLGATHWYDSGKLLGYYCTDYNNDCESGRLLKRAEFLRAVCEKEGIAWIDSQGWCHCKNPKTDGYHQSQGKCEREETQTINALETKTRERDELRKRTKELRKEIDKGLADYARARLLECGYDPDEYKCQECGSDLVCEEEKKCTITIIQGDGTERVVELKNYDFKFGTNAVQIQVCECGEVPDGEIWWLDRKSGKANRFCNISTDAQ